MLRATVRLQVSSFLPVHLSQVVGLTGAAPFLRGASICLMETPHLGWRLTGLASGILKSDMVDGIVRDLLADNLAMVVNPRKLCFPLSVVPGLPQGIKDSIRQLEPGVMESVVLPRPR